MAIDGLIILDNTGRPIIQSGFRSSATAYPLLHIDAFNNAAAKAPQPDAVDPVLYVPSSSLDSPSACCHVACGDMRFLCAVSDDADPLIAFAFLRIFIEILHEYFGVVSATSLKENFDVVYQLLEETLDSGGHPLTTSTNALRDIVLPPSLLTKLLNVAGANFTSTINAGSGMGVAGGPFSSPVPWRKANLRYASNEVYFDVVETLKAIVNKHGVALSSIVWGSFEANVRLSGTPDCLLTFTNPGVLADCAFHPCVRQQRWSRDKVLSFIPPDGKFALMDYRYSPSVSQGLIGGSSVNTTAPSSPAAITKESVPVPIAIKSTVEIDAHSGTFDVTVTSRLTTRAIEKMTVEFKLGQGAGGIKCVVGRGTGGNAFGRGMGNNDVVASGAGASWAFIPNRQVLRWEIPNMPPSSSWNMCGSFTSGSSTPSPTHAFQVRFEISAHTLSGLKVEQLKIPNEQYKPYKGVRGRLIGDIEWRW